MRSTFGFPVHGLVAVPTTAVPSVEALAAASGAYPFHGGHAPQQYFATEEHDVQHHHVDDDLGVHGGHNASHVQESVDVPHRAAAAVGNHHDNGEFTGAAPQQSPQAVKLEEVAQAEGEEALAVRPKGRRFTRAEVDLLNEVFRKNQNPDLELRTQLAEHLGNGVTPRIVYVWFQNRRQKKRREEAMGSEEHVERGSSITAISTTTVGDSRPKRGRPRKTPVPVVPQNATEFLESLRHQSVPLSVDSTAGYGRTSLSEADDGVDQRPKATTPKRRRFTPDQLATLNEAFTENTRPHPVRRQQLSHSLQVPLHSVDVWFQNQRQKVRRQSVYTPLDKE